MKIVGFIVSKALQPLGTTMCIIERLHTRTNMSDKGGRRLNKVENTPDITRLPFKILHDLFSDMAVQ